MSILQLDSSEVNGKVAQIVGGQNKVNKYGRFAVVEARFRGANVEALYGLGDRS
jgi:hypothetical protein